MHKSKIIYNQHLIYSKGGISFMNNKKGFKTISIILALICIVFLSIFLRYRYELYSLKNEIVNMPPVWTATHTEKSNETALGNENSVARPPVRVRLRKGWNHVFLKLPVGRFTIPEVRLVKWMFTVAFVTLDGDDWRA